MFEYMCVRRYISIVLQVEDIGHLCIFVTVLPEFMFFGSQFLYKNNLLGSVQVQINISFLEVKIWRLWIAKKASYLYSISMRWVGSFTSLSHRHHYSVVMVEAHKFQHMSISLLFCHADSPSRYIIYIFFLIHILFRTVFASVDLLWRVHKPVIRMRMCVWSNTMNIELSSYNIPAFIDSSPCTQNGHEKHMMLCSIFRSVAIHSYIPSSYCELCVGAVGVLTPLLPAIVCIASFRSARAFGAPRERCSAGDIIFRHFAVDLIIIILVIIYRLPH